MRVLVTGHRGYIGSVLTSVLRHAGHQVFGLDIDLFQGCDFGRTALDVQGFNADIRDVEFVDLLSFDAVVHLAGLSDDASTDLDGPTAESINLEATVRLAECSKQAGITRFLFASSCSVYGRTGEQPVDELSPTAPQTAYAKHKLAAEQALLGVATADFRPTILRLATVFGVSPRLRLDLAVNDLVACAVTSGRMSFRSDGQAWRPFVHVEDVARALAALVGQFDVPATHPILNLVAPEGNVKISQLGDEISQVMGDVAISYSANLRDERSYAVDGAAFARVCPWFRFRWTIHRGIRQLAEALGSCGLTRADWRSDRFRRAARLRAMLEARQLDPSLRPQHALALAS